MKMKLNDHEKIGQVVLRQVEILRSSCLIYADMALNNGFADVSESVIIHFKAYMLMLGALEDLCNEYDFDVISGGDCEND